MYEYSFIIVIMIFEYYSNICSTRYKFCDLKIVSQAALFIWVKRDQGRMQCDVESSEVFHIIDSINIQLGPNWQQSTTKMALARLRCDTDSFGSISYNWYYHIRSGKRHICSAVPPTKPAQAISSIFSPNIQLGPNWQQSTTKMAVARLRCDGDSFKSISYHWYYDVR